MCDALEIEVQSLMDEEFFGYEKQLMDKDGRNTINPTFLLKVTQEFEKRAQRVYFKLYKEFSSQSGRAVDAFRRAQQNKQQSSWGTKTGESLNDIELADAAPMPSSYANSEIIEQETEIQFANYL
jgi:hypothetical protein